MSYFDQASGKLSAGWKSGIDKIGSAIPTDAAIAEKLGMGQYKPKNIDIKEQAFTDMTRSDEQMELLKRQMQGVEGRKFSGAEAASLGNAQTMNAVQLDPAARMRAASLGPASQMRGATIDQSQQAQMRAGQQDLIAALQAQAAGEGPSLAAMQMDDARQQNIATAMAMAASQRGLGAGQGLRQIADQTQMANQQAARDAVRGRLAEQMAAQGQLGSVLSGARAQDIGLATDQAGLMQQAGLSNQAAQNQFALQQSALEQDAAARNQAALNQFALTQGAMGQDAASQNMAAANQFKLQQGLFGQQTAIANQQAQLQQQAQQDALMQALTAQMGQERLGQDTRLMDLARMQFQRDVGMENMNAAAYGERQKAVTGMIGGLAQAGATLAMKKPT